MGRMLQLRKQLITGSEWVPNDEGKEKYEITWSEPEVISESVDFKVLRRLENEMRANMSSEELGKTVFWITPEPPVKEAKDVEKK